MIILVWREEELKRKRDGEALGSFGMNGTDGSTRPYMAVPSVPKVSTKTYPTRPSETVTRECYLGDLRRRDQTVEWIREERARLEQAVKRQSV